MHGSINWLIDWLIDSLIDWSIDWLIGRLIDWLVDWLIDCDFFRFDFDASKVEIIKLTLWIVIVIAEELGKKNKLNVVAGARVFVLRIYQTLYIWHANLAKIDKKWWLVAADNF